MARSPSTYRKISSALKAAKAAGVEVRVEVRPDGTVIVTPVWIDPTEDQEMEVRL